MKTSNKTNNNTPSPCGEGRGGVRLLLIIQREYLQIVAKKSFIFTTILLPILMVALCGILPVFLANMKSDELKNVAVIDETASQKYLSVFEDTEDYHFVKINQAVPGDQLYNYYTENKEASDLYAIVWIPDSVVQNEVFYVYSDQTINSSLEKDVAGLLEDALEKEKIASYGIDSLEVIMADCRVDLSAKNVKWDEGGEEKISSSLLSEILGFALATLTYMFVLMYGAMIMNGVIEEKTNRIVEVIVSTCKPMELMLGKIIGVALVGFTQIFIWAALLAVAGMVLGISVLGTSMMGPGGDIMAQAAAQGAELPSEFAEIVQMILNVNYTQILVFFVLYFIGGYLLYAALFAAFGSAVDQPSDASQFMTPIMLIMIFGFYAGIFSIENPDGPLAWWCSIIPFTSPIVMMIRLPYDVPVWEMALSITLLYGMSLAITYLAGRIYRTGILMYGKKVSIKEIMKWIK